MKLTKEEREFLRMLIKAERGALETNLVYKSVDLPMSYREKQIERIAAVKYHLSMCNDLLKKLEEE